MANLYKHFKTGSATHSQANAALLALPSLFAYKDSISWPGAMWQEFTKLFNALSEDDPFEVESFDGHYGGLDIQAAAMVNSKLVLVIFRGTELKLVDWATNFQYKWRTAPTAWGSGIRVHTGYYNGLNAVYSSVRSFVKPLQSGRHVFLAGHSQGGALATLCAYRLAKVGGIKVAGVYSWGSPRVGNDKWASRFNTLLGNRCFRWVRGSDFAARIPSVNILPGPGQAYFHVGQLNYIHADGSVDMSHPDFESGGPPSSMHHSMKAYATKMINLLPVSPPRTGPNSPGFLLRQDVNGAKVVGQKKIPALIQAAAGS